MLLVADLLVIPAPDVTNLKTSKCPERDEEKTRGYYLVNISLLLFGFRRYGLSVLNV